MPTYYYKFDLTQNYVTNSQTEGRTSYDLSEFDDDPRGTVRVANWDSDLSNFNESDLDAMIEVLSSDHGGIYHTYETRDDGTVGGASIGWLSRYETNALFKNSSPIRHYYASTATGSGFTSTILSSNPLKVLSVGSWYNSRRVLVYFPNHVANGGHTYLSVNNTTTTWSSSNARFESADASVTLEHNGSTWRITDNSSIYDASYNSTDVGDYVDPASSDLTWESGGSVSLVSAGASGDPHINPILGKPYII